MANNTIRKIEKGEYDKILTLRKEGSKYAYIASIYNVSIPAIRYIIHGRSSVSTPEQRKRYAAKYGNEYFKKKMQQYRHQKKQERDDN